MVLEIALGIKVQSHPVLRLRTEYLLLWLPAKRPLAIALSASQGRWLRGAGRTDLYLLRPIITFKRETSNGLLRCCVCGMGRTTMKMELLHQLAVPVSCTWLCSVDVCVETVAAVAGEGDGT